MEKIKILIADDHRLFLDGVDALLKEADHFIVVGKATSGDEVKILLATHDVDIALIDISMPGIDGIETTEYIYHQFPGVKVLGLSMHNQVPYIVKMMKAGAKGYLLKHINKEDLICAIETVYKGGVYYSPEVAVQLVNKLFREGVNEVFPNEELSARELEIVKLIIKGDPNKIIADKLFITEATVKTHRQRILHKLQLKNTSELIKYAYDRNLD